MFLNFLGRMLNGKLGAINQSIAGALVGWLASLLTEKLGVTMTVEIQNELRLAFMGIGVSIMTIATQWWQVKQNAKVQAALNAKLPASQKLKEDGNMGEKTLQGAKAIVRAVPVP